MNMSGSASPEPDEAIPPGVCPRPVGKMNPSPKTRPPIVVNSTVNQAASAAVTAPAGPSATAEPVIAAVSLPGRTHRRSAPCTSRPRSPAVARRATHRPKRRPRRGARIRPEPSREPELPGRSGTGSTMRSRTRPPAAPTATEPKMAYGRARRRIIGPPPIEANGGRSRLDHYHGSLFGARRSASSGPARREAGRRIGWTVRSAS